MLAQRARLHGMLLETASQHDILYTAGPQARLNYVPPSTGFSGRIFTLFIGQSGPFAALQEPNALLGDVEQFFALLNLEHPKQRVRLPVHPRRKSSGIPRTAKTRIRFDQTSHPWAGCVAATARDLTSVCVPSLQLDPVM